MTGVIDVMGSKRRFAEIWPLRSYKIRPDTVSAACQRPSWTGGYAIPRRARS